MSRKPRSGSRAAIPSEGGRGPAEREVRVIDATKRLAIGNATSEDWEVFFVDLLTTTGLYEPQSFAEYTAKTGRPDAFPLHTALHAARVEVVQRVLKRLNLSDADLIRLERAAIAERSARNARG